ncbi:Hypothetical predicted protein [Octopus vulgaris]|uniref:Uncharacterized protein n=1 Tax=Octopus vulgaris TaxID=6645 RepID=A0AA36B0L0_OCTVU|nr:Hypothetical predicted protein [Octopus vulgaris]
MVASGSSGGIDSSDGARRGSTVPAACDNAVTKPIRQKLKEKPYQCRKLEKLLMIGKDLIRADILNLSMIHADSTPQLEYSVLVLFDQNENEQENE